VYKAIIIGGSAGSFQVVASILQAMPPDFNLPIIICLHRLKHVRSGFVEALSIKSKIPVLEPYDKDIIKPGKAYLAPANYHMYIELGNRFALSTEENVNHSRPSIDLSFITAANAYQNKLVGVILSGANKDGAYGLRVIADMGGFTIVQDPSQCEMPTMTEGAIQLSDKHNVWTVEKIINFLINLK
jgi:two-component system chemotaxis response regulator CheB